MPRTAMIRPRRGTAAQWAVAEAGGPALAAGELAVVDGQVVTGDGTSKVAALVNGGSGSPDIVIWGDSLTAQMGVGVPALASATGRTVRNGGVGGESSTGIAARQGARPYRLLPAGGNIPASGPVTVTLAEPAGEWPLLQGSGTDIASVTEASIPGTFAGVAGVLKLTQPGGASYNHQASDVYTFTRTVPGAAVAVTRPTPFVSDFAPLRRSDIQVIWAGTNTGAGNSRVLGDVAAMIDNILGNPRRFLVVSPLTGRGNGTGTPTNVERLALNAALSDRYGRNFLDLRTYLVQYGIQDLGMSAATSSDAADIAADIPPNILRVDAIHLTAAAKVVAANAIARRLFELGYVSTYTPGSPGATPAGRTNLLTNGSFEASTAGWRANGGGVLARVTSQSFDGLAAASFTHVDGAATGLASDVGLIPVSAGAVLNYRAWVKATAVGGEQVRLMVHQYNGGTYLTNTGVTATPTGDWQLLTGQATMGASATGVVLEVNRSGPTVGAPVWYIDGIELWT